MTHESARSDRFDKREESGQKIAYLLEIFKTFTFFLKRNLTFFLKLSLETFEMSIFKNIRTICIIQNIIIYRKVWTNSSGFSEFLLIYTVYNLYEYTSIQRTLCASNCVHIYMQIYMNNSLFSHNEDTAL